MGKNVKDIIPTVLLFINDMHRPSYDEKQTFADLLSWKKNNQ